MQLAQLNIAELRFPNGDSRIADFTNNLDRINAVAERSPGFVWRFKVESGNATTLSTPWPKNFIVNMSVWDAAEHLEHFVWNTVHKQIYNRKAEWFMAMKTHHFVMWYVEPGHEPDLDEAKARLDHLDSHGDSDHAFTWAHLPHVRLWQSQRCG